MWPYNGNPQSYFRSNQCRPVAAPPLGGFIFDPQRLEIPPLLLVPSDRPILPQTCVITPQSPNFQQSAAEGTYYAPPRPLNNFQAVNFQREADPHFRPSPVLGHHPVVPRLSHLPRPDAFYYAQPSGRYLSSVPPLIDYRPSPPAVPWINSCPTTALQNNRSLQPPPPPPPKPRLININNILNAAVCQTRPQRIVIILRGLPGSGKTYAARAIKEKEFSISKRNPRILSIDDYFMVEPDDETSSNVQKYEFNAGLEKSYRASLLKSFKKTVDDNLFPFIIVDSCNDKISYFDEYVAYALPRGFAVYVGTLTADTELCKFRSQGRRKSEDVELMAKFWEQTPDNFLQVDVMPLVQPDINTVEMEDVKDEKESSQNRKRKCDSDPVDAGEKKSKWELMDVTDEQIDRLDGLRLKRSKSSKKSDASVTGKEGVFTDSGVVLFDNLKNEDISLKNPFSKKHVSWADVEHYKRSLKERHNQFDRLLSEINARSALVKIFIVEKEFCDCCKGQLYMALAALLEDEADLPLSPDGEEDIEAIAGLDMGLALGHPGASSDSPGLPLLEACLLGNEEVMIPSELCLNPDIFIDVMSLGWASLTDQERIGLLKCLPAFPEPENDFQEKLKTLDGLFAGADFHFGNPLKQFHASLSAGFYQPDVFRLREVSRKLKFHAHLERQQRHTVSLLCDLATSRQQMLLDARCLPPAAMDTYRLNKRMGGLVDKKPLAVKLARSRYTKIMVEVRQEAGWLDTSSSGEEIEDGRQLQNQFGDMALNGAVNEESIVRSCLKIRCKSLKKVQKELASSTSPLLPPLDLNEVLERSDIKPIMLSAGKVHKQQPVNGASSLLLNKPKKPGQRRSRLEVLKLQCSDVVRKMLTAPLPISQQQHIQVPMAPQQQLPPPPICQPMSIKNSPIDMNNVMVSNNLAQPSQQQVIAPPLPPPPPPIQPQPRSRPQSSVALTPTPPPGPPSASNSSLEPTPQQVSPSGGQQREASPPQLPSNLIATTSAGKIESFFHVVQALLSPSLDCRATLSSMEQLVKQWVQMASAVVNSPNPAAWHLRWMNDRSNWHNELPSALRYLSGTFCPANYPPDFVPLADMNDRSGHWVWLEEEQELSPNSSQYLSLLYRCWLDAQLAERQLSLLTSPFRPESEQDLYFFHDQERKRFQAATEPYIYVLTAPIQRELVVGPVRISPSRADSFSSSRKGLKDHSILTTERPPAVTVLTLVRDAVARLAGGEGTRTDICNLLRDSQFIRRDLNSHQLTNAVSGALDRLHSERDPCVRFDTAKKLWVYLHRGRTRDDFFRIGQMLMLAAKRRQNRDTGASSGPGGSAVSSNAPTPTTVNGLTGPTTVPPNATMPNVLPSPTGKGPGSGSKSNAASRRASAAVDNPANSGGTVLQRKGSMQSFPTEPQQQPPMMQQPVMLPPQMMQAQQLPSPGQQQQMSFSGPPNQMIRGQIPPQQLQQLQQTQQQSPRQVTMQQMPQQGPPQMMAPPSQNQPGMVINWPPQNQMAMMGQNQPNPQMMAGPPQQQGQPGMMPPQMHMVGPGPMRHQAPMHMIMPPQQQQQMHFQPPQQPQYHPQMHHHQMHHGMAPPQQHMQPQQLGPQPGMMEQQYYAEQTQMPTNQQQMLMFHHQQAQQQQYRLVHQQVASPTHQFAPPQPPQNMMQQQPHPAQFQQHPHGM